MALEKITEAQMDAKGVCAAPDILNGTPAQNKSIFDRMVRQLIAPAYNACVDLVNTLETAEDTRQAAEALRVSAEDLRAAAETARDNAESGRITAEEARAEAERLRRSAEKLRADAEVLRIQAEEERISNETARKQSEKTRAEAEESRVTAEQEREDKESSRQTAELWRLEAEAERVAAEQARADENAGIVAQATEKAVEAASSAASAASSAADAESSAEQASASESAAADSEKTAGEAADSACADRLEAQYIARVIQHGQLPTDLPTNLILEAGKAVTYSATDTEPYTVPTVAKSLELGRRYQVLISGTVYAEFLWTGKTVYVGRNEAAGTYLVSVSGEMAYDQTTYKLTLQNGTMGFAPNSGRSVTVTLKAVDDSALPPSRGIELDNTLTKEGKAADAAAVGARLSSISEEIASLPGGGGQAGKDGVGIQSVEQTTTSTEDGGTNIVTVTKTDGTTSAFTVRNGSKGSTGPAGADGKDGAPGKDGAAGKSAYQYAQDGGYTGTEEEFAAVLAGKSVTSYVSAAVDEIVTKMKAVQGPGTFNFVLLTDLHYCPVKYGQVYENLSDYDTVVKNIVDAVNLVNEEVGLELLLTLGDNVEGQNYTDSTTGLPSTTAGRAAQSLGLIRAKVNNLEVAFRALNIPRLSCKGNHDDGSISAYYGESDHKYYLGYIMQDGDYYNRFFRRNANSGRVTLSDDVSDLAAYVDLDTSKVRLIALNSVDIPYTANSDGSCVYLDGLGQYMGGQHVFGYSQAQLDWFANVALDFSGKRRPGEWSVMIFQHHPVLSTFGKRANSTPDYQTFNYDVFAGIVNAYQHGTAYSHASATGKTQSGAESSYFACEVSADFSAQGAGKVISIWNGHIHRDLYSKTVFDGYESNTEITPNFTNRFSNTDPDFQSGYRLNSSGGVSADSAYWVSGYIPLTKGQTLRVKYGSTDSAPVWASRPCLLPFNSSKAKNGDPVYSSTTTHGITLDSDNAGFTYVCELDNNAYVRISGRGTGDGVIVTVDEEISYTEQTTDGDGVQTVFISTMLANPNEGSADAAWDGTKYGHEVGTASETSVDFVTVDTSSKIIYTFRYGAGADREISY